MGIIHTAKKNLVAELVRKKEMLKLEDIRRTERVERDLTRAERAEVRLQNLCRTFHNSHNVLLID